ncbi:peptidoglycan-binding protein LysM [Myxococcus sp. K15C18031901]|uniref:peptidoglycan-binding protein LysM n=1 Tax=Myxococcus dinghuensis TaxID=2906761 RepID=UPI0020A7ECDB|nr:peptidoglycan-binding protein LysM [Myxococcus dinghuensis]MCP3103763.1 peptidoglycan-binding protein LysM [Myxococcus dinghuensis]
MRTALLLVAWLGLTPAQDSTVVGANESLREVATRVLGDAAAAAELRALNNLSSDTVAEGTRLKLPGQERVLALKALETARTLLAQAKDAPGLPEATARLKAAEEHFRAARYPQASEAANAAGAQVAAPGAPQASAFTVQVHPDAGTTTVTVTRGPPVRVEAEGVTRPVGPGETVSVEKGHPPTVPPSPPAIPRPEQPAEGALLKRRADAQGKLGPVKLVWAAVAGAERYEVEVLRDAQPTPVLAQASTAPELKLPLLPAGRYRWTVRAVGGAGRSERSAPRLFELAPDKLKLEVQKGQWQ